MKEKRMDFNKDNSTKANDNNSRSNMERKLNTNFIKALMPQTSSMNFLGEGRFDDELVFSYEY